MSLEKNLDRVLARYDELVKLMAAKVMPPSEEFARMSKECADLMPMIEAINLLLDARSEMVDLADLIADTDGEPEMRELAEAEFAELKERVSKLECRVQLLLLPKDEADTKNAILEIRAGTGGDEAALFAADLFRMYRRYAERRGWKFEPLNVNEIGIGGYKEAIVSINGSDVFARLKFESGVHRVQRVPVTESGGRIHTSAATVAVMPEAEEVDVQIDDIIVRHMIIPSRNSTI